jgi:threonine dehydrogenase-like Zn-dependent dehydrogenase
MRVAFTAAEVRADGAIGRASYVFDGSEDDGWVVERDGAVHLRLGPGYRPLRTSHCGICATDLARRHLPFPLPQVTGHEVVAIDADGRPVVIEINASHMARGVPSTCAYCAQGLPTHCPDRLVLGIHDLPGGFGPWILAPRHSIIRVPRAIDARTATLVEPFAAALHAVRIVTRVPRRRIAVLGPRRLGSLVVAALDAWRRRTGARYEILALARRPELRRLAAALGADDTADPDHARGGLADVVIDTTGSPAGLERALALATHEVHVKTTCGAPAAGLRRATALVVDELTLVPPDRTLAAPLHAPPLATAIVLPSASDETAATLLAGGLRAVAIDALSELPLGAADVAIVGTLADIDWVVRPDPGREHGLVRPRGIVVVAPRATADGPLAQAVAERGLTVTTSRCGDFRDALALLPDVAAPLAARLLTAVRPADELAAAFAAAASPSEVKVVVAQPDALI